MANSNLDDLISRLSTFASESAPMYPEPSWTRSKVRINAHAPTLKQIAADRPYDKAAHYDKLHGKAVTIDGVQGHLRHVSYMAKYPREEMVHKLEHVASANGKKTMAYQHIKKKLGDDWITDVGNNPDRLTEVSNKLGISQMKNSNLDPMVEQLAQFASEEKTKESPAYDESRRRAFAVGELAQAASNIANRSSLALDRLAPYRWASQMHKAAHLLHSSAAAAHSHTALLTDTPQEKKERKEDADRHTKMMAHHNRYAKYMNNV